MDKNRNITGAIIGVVLVLIGILSLFGRYFVFLNMDYLWPLFVVVVGAVFFVVMFLGDKSRGGLAVPGSILVTIGLILFVMNLTNTWEAWSYCWTLIICASGIGMWINGQWSDQPELRKRGFATLRSGIILFIIFGVIMEFIFSVSGVARWGSLLLWSILLTLVGIYLLVTRILKVGKPDSAQVDLFWPILMVGAGLVGIFAQLNWMTADNIGRMVNLWPVLLIVAGVGLILRHRSPWIGALLGLILVACLLVVGFAGAQLGLASGVDWLTGIGPFQFEGGRETIIGSGNLVTETRPVSGVSRVELMIDANLEIQQGSQESLQVTGDDNILPVLQTNVVGGKLNIRYQPQVNVREIRQPKLVLMVKDLTSLRLSSSGTVNVGPLTTGNFDLDLTSSCNVSFQDIKADRITTNITSSGDIDIQGTANSLQLNVSSSGNFRGEDLQVQRANVSLTSSGDVTLWVVESLDVHLSSSGNVAYYGNPTIHQSTSSSGRLVPKGEK
ncbi:MAG: head GIN domain-containing protein [Acidobacteriaceae bacterium]